MREYVSPERITEFGVTFAPSLPTISNHLSEEIQKLGITYKEAAERVGISRQALDMYSRGELQPTIEIALKLSMLLNKPVEQLFKLEKGAWFTSAKDENGHSIYYDHMRRELVSGSAMKGVSKLVRFDKDVNETMSTASFKELVKEQEELAVEEVLKREGKENHNRDTLARVKEAVREELEKQYPLRYEAMYEELPVIK